MDQSPIHIAKTYNRIIAFAAEDTLIFISVNGRITNTLVCETRIVDFKWNDSLLCILLDSKNLLFYSIISLENMNCSLLNTVAIPKRANSLLLDGDSAIIGDKFGDVVRYTPHSKEGRLLLGHVSILTYMAWGPERKFLISSDRDEVL
jgi:hypothetical protein